MTVSLDWHWIFFCPTVLQIKCESSNNYSFSKINLILYFQEIKNIDWESYISLKKNRLLALCYATNCALGELPLRVMHISVTILSEYPQLSVNTSSWKLKPTSHAMCMMSGHCKASDNWLKVFTFHWNSCYANITMDHSRKKWTSHVFCLDQSHRQIKIPACWVDAIVNFSRKTSVTYHCLLLSIFWQNIKVEDTNNN